ncbi:MAG: hypothetical protein CSA03_02330 [Bacteroidetes bacterium]|nr:MAG: hypothetical protein CSA03_02330 [Bacteroidota bacterium]
MMKYAIYFLMIFGSIFSSRAQQLLEEISHDNILIGEPVSIRYVLKTKMTDTLAFSEKQGVIEGRFKSGGTLSQKGAEFEIIGKFKDTIVALGMNKKWIGEYVVTAWEDGEYIIPGPTISINDSTFRFDDLALQVSLVEQKKDVDLYEIRENFTDIPDQPFSPMKFLKQNWWWIAIVAGALIFGWLLVRRRRWDKEIENREDIRPMNLKERTIKAVEALDKSELWKKGELKEHFVELSYILRSYLTARYKISLLEKTTEQTKYILTKQGLNAETVDTIARILSQSDMVKFAKSKPDTISILRQSTLVKQIIAETSPLDFDNAD